MVGEDLVNLAAAVELLLSLEGMNMNAETRGALAAIYVSMEDLAERVEEMERNLKPGCGCQGAGGREPLPVPGIIGIQTTIQGRKIPLLLASYN